jgi:hypothetical protein
MALQMNYTHSQLGTIYNAYWRINTKKGLVGGKEEMNYVLEVYKDAGTARAKDSKPLDKVIKTFVPDMKSKKNFIEQAYNHAKTTSEFTGSVDA